MATTRSAADAILKITTRVPGITRTLLFYRLLQFALLPFLLFYFLFRLITERGYSNRFSERLGFLSRSFTRTKPNSVWLHAVSVGEVISAVPLIKHIRREEPAIALYLSVSTVAGRRAAEREAESLIDGVFYAPIDYVSCIRRTIRAIRPALLIVLETEIWPNLYVEAKLAGASLALVNARISNRAWPRYRRLNFFFRPVLQLANAIYLQSAVDLERYRALGVLEHNLHVEANLKYDAATPGIPAGIPVFDAGRVWIAASTVGPNERGSLQKHAVDEDDIVIRTFQELAVEFPKLLLILAPRQPARFDAVAQKLKRISFPFVRRSEMKPGEKLPLSLPGVLLLDTLGELSSTYKHADAVFVGGSIAPRGGHNIIEPAAAGAPVIVGPHMQNFDAIARDFLDAHALVQIKGEAELLPAMRSLLSDRGRARELGEFGRRVVEMRRGVAQRLTPILLGLYFRGRYKPPRNAIFRACLRLLAFIWRVGGERKRRRGAQYASSVAPLGVPVISIGGITIGGSGKTPFTTYLASQLATRNYAPAILTRGYRRRSPAENVVLAPGAKVPSSLTGDEAQILLRSGVAPIGIGSNRYETARVVLDRFPATNIFLLDDGFQHARLPRDLDIVVIDGLDPLGECELVPLGRLREPLSSLERASAFVVTRAESDLRFHSICQQLREHNATAPVFRTRLIARNWRDYQTGECIDLKNQRVAAFCGLGNPQNFWDTLDSLGLDVVFRWAFNDHHTYQPKELYYLARQAILHGAELLVTTEKDRMNFPGRLSAAIAPLMLAWLEIEMELQDSAAFFAFLESKLRRRSAA
jgi:tetraacyldisaccharide 4'-kinase